MSSHPHFADIDGLSWHTTLEEGMRAAAREGKLLFVELSRPTCSSCRNLFEELLPDPDCSTPLKESFVCVSLPSHNPDPTIMEIGAAHMPYASMLPVCFYLTAEGDFLHGSTGRLDKQVFTADMRHAKNQAARLAEAAEG